MYRYRAALMCALAFFVAAPAAGQHEMHGPAAVIEHDTAIALFTNLGPHSRAISTRSPGAQAYFNQGMRLAFSFGMPEARRSFEAAIRQDPDCAMCHWGLAWSLGPFVNSPADSASRVRAHEHSQHARRLARQAPPVERALIEAVAARNVAVPTRANRTAMDTLYMHAMRDVAQRFPDDLDVVTLYGESIMLLRPWNYWTRGGEPQPGIEELMLVLESVLDRDLRHPGACHLYIHATEASQQPERAEKCADLLLDAVPGASHMRHMPSHTYMRIGRYGDAVRSNQLARLADQEAEHGGATAIFPLHNLHMLLFAGAYDGQSAVAIQAARDLGRLVPAAGYHLPLVLARFGRWDEVLEVPAATDVPFRHALTSYAHGVAHVRKKQLPAARVSLAAVEAVQRETTNRTQRHMLTFAQAILSAEIDAAGARYDDAIATLRAARVIEADSLAYSEPEDWIVPVRHVLGAILLEAGRNAEAEAEYRGELEAHPANGWSLLGLHHALAAQGRTDEAAEVLEQFQRAWARADVAIRGSRF